MRNSLFPLAAMLAVQLLVAMALVTVPVLAPVLAHATGLPLGFVGLFVAAAYAASMSASLVSGALVQRYGAIRLSQFCLVACAAGLVCVVSGAPLLLAAGALLLGAGYGPVTPASSHVLAGAVVPALVLFSGWRAAALAVAAACLASLLFVQPLRASFDADRDPARRIAAADLAGTLRYTLGDPRLRRLAFSSFCFASLQVCLITFLVAHLTLNMGYSLVRAGLMLTAAQAGGVVARIVWGAIADRWGRPMVLLGLIAVGMGLSALAMGRFTPQWPTVAVALVCAAFGATAIGWNGVYLAQVARLAPPGKAGDATGGSLAFTFCGVLFGPPIFAFLVEGGVSYASAFVLLALPAVACGLWLLWRDR